MREGHDILTHSEKTNSPLIQSAYTFLLMFTNLPYHPSSFKRTIHPKMRILSLFTHPYDFLSSVGQFFDGIALNEWTLEISS